MTREEVLDMIQNEANVAGRDYLLVDVRRADHEVCAKWIAPQLARSTVRRRPCKMLGRP